MKITLVLFVALTSVGCAAIDAPTPSAMVGTADADACRAEAAAALYPSSLATPTPSERSYPWTAGRDWGKNSVEERLRERDIFEACMAQGARPVDR